MTDYLVNHSQEIDRARLSDMHQNDRDGTAMLEIKAYYMKDARRRGLKLSVYRCLVGGGFRSYDLMNRHNGLIHLADMDRKPSAKVAAIWAARINARLAEIATTALASDTPDWSAVAALFADVTA